MTVEFTSFEEAAVFTRTWLRSTGAPDAVVASVVPEVLVREIHRFSAPLPSGRFMRVMAHRRKWVIRDEDLDLVAKTVQTVIGVVAAVASSTPAVIVPSILGPLTEVVYRIKRKGISIEDPIRYAVLRELRDRKAAASAEEIAESLANDFGCDFDANDVEAELQSLTLARKADNTPASIVTKDAQGLWRTEGI